MSGTYLATGAAILFTWYDVSRKAARCADTSSATAAARLLNRARYFNDVKRQYTKAARLIATAEALPGFEWLD